MKDKLLLVHRSAARTNIFFGARSVMHKSSCHESIKIPSTELHRNGNIMRCGVNNSIRSNWPGKTGCILRLGSNTVFPALILSRSSASSLLKSKSTARRLSSMQRFMIAFRTPGLIYVCASASVGLKSNAASSSTGRGKSYSAYLSCF